MNAAPALAAPGHNRPQITAPTDQDWLDDLRRRYPEIETELKAFEEAAATYPDEIPLDKPDVAEALQDLIAQINKKIGVWEAWHKQEKGPWNTIIVVTKNFFQKPLDVLGEKETPKKQGSGLLGKLGKTYKGYLDLKEAEARKLALEQLERDRAAADAERQRAEAARIEREENERKAAEAKAREDAARQAEEDAKARRAEQDRLVEAAAEQERQRVAALKAAKRQEEQELVTVLHGLKPLLKRANAIHALAETDQATEAEIAELDQLVKLGGTIGTIAQPLGRMVHLEDEDVAKVASLKSELSALRDGILERANARQRRVIREQQAAEDARLETERQAREAQRQADLTAAAEAKAQREQAQAEAQKARDDAAAARAEINEAKDERRTATAGAKEAGKAERDAEGQAERTSNRADRQEARIDAAAPADFNRTRGDMGSVGGTRRMWVPLIQDMEALRASMGPLGPHLGEDAISAAVTNFMRVHQPGFTGERVEGLLPGVIFTYERDFSVRGS